MGRERGAERLGAGQACGIGDGRSVASIARALLAVIAAGNLATLAVSATADPVITAECETLELRVWMGSAAFSGWE
jgi:hypothetical protein